MEVLGRVHNGVVVPEGEPLLPQGVSVAVRYPAPKSAKPVLANRLIELPLVHCDQPGTGQLTGEQIAEILDVEDAAAGR